MMFYVEYKIDKLNFTKLLNSFNREEIKVFSIKYHENSVTFRSKPCEKKKILAIFDKSVYTNMCITTNSPKTILQKNMYSIIGIIIFLIIAYLPLVLVLDCRIECSDEILTKQIEYVLKDYQLDNWKYLSNAEENSIEKKIMEMEGVSFCQVSKKGGKLYLEVKGSLSPEVKEHQNRIIATKSGIITNMLVLSGTPLVTVGDYVEVGDVLIDGVVYSKEKDKYINVKAEGEVLAETTIELSDNIYDNGLIFSETNEKSLEREVYFYDKPLKKSKSPYEYSVKSESSVIIGIFPFKIKTVEYTKCDYSFYESEFIIEQETCREKLLERELALVNNGKVISREFLLEEYVGYKTIILKSVVEMEIS